MRRVYIELKGEQHPLCYNVTAAEVLEEFFGSMDEWQKAFTAGSPKVRTIRQTLEAFLAGGRAACIEDNIPVPPPIHNVGAVIDITSPEPIKAIFESLKADSKRTVEVASKNAEPTQEN